MTIANVSAWLLMLLPLSFSPGPANILFASSGAAFGFRRTVPLLLGTNLVCILQSLVIGAGMGALLLLYPYLLNGFKYAGCMFMLYLAYKFFRMGTAVAGSLEAPGFLDGCILEFFNFKFLIIPLLMFSQFLGKQESDWDTIPLLTLALGLITLAANSIWILGGDAIHRLLGSVAAVKIQGRIYGCILLGVAVWMALR